MNIPHVAWRDGKPRFNPSETLRAQGHKGHDLKNADGSWMTEGQALDWSKTFVARIDGDRQKIRDRKAREKKKAAAAVRQKIPPAAVRKSYTLGQLLEDYLRHGTTELKGNSLRTYTAMVRAIEQTCPEPWFSEADAITRRVVKGMYKDLRATRGVSMSYLSVRVLSIAFNWAIDDDEAGDKVTIANPAMRIKMKRPDERTRSASVAEYLHLVATADAIGEPEVGDMVVWGAWMGQRGGDRLMMQVEHIRDGRLEIIQEKTGAKVSIALPQAVRERMQARPELERGYLIPVAAEGRQQRASRAYNRYTRVKREAMKTMPSIADLRDQDLRDTIVSWMGRARCTIPEIFAVTGHKFKNETAILGHYMAIDFEMADNAIAKLETWFAKERLKLGS